MNFTLRVALSCIRRRIANALRFIFGAKAIAQTAILLALVHVGTASVMAAPWPEKPVRLVVPYAAGGNLDVSARILASKLEARLGQPFIVDNRPGAGGLVAGEFVAKSAADGYTLFVAANGPLLYSPLILHRPVYIWDKDFVPIGSISFTPMVIQVTAALPVHDLKSLLALSRKQDLFMASAGSGSAPHLLSEFFQARTGAHWTTVQYKGSAPALTALLTGECSFSVELVSTSLPQIQAGTLRALAVTSHRRIATLPDVPTVAEEGFPYLEAETFSGLFAPIGTPSETQKRLATALAESLDDPDVVARFAAMQSDARSMTPTAFSAYLHVEYDKWSEIIKRANIQAE